MAGVDDAQYIPSEDLEEIPYAILDGTVHGYYLGDLDSMGEPDGYGIFRTPRVVYEGYWKNGKLNGNGWREGDGITYSGGLLDGRAHGYGEMTYADGETYKGDFKDGKKHGEGEYTWADGATYKGGYKDDKEHSESEFNKFTSEHEQYIGQTKDGKRHGKGVLLYPDGTGYRGQFKDGKPHGEGQRISSNIWGEGSVHRGKFEYGEYVGDAPPVAGYKDYLYVSPSKYKGGGLKHTRRRKNKRSKRSKRSKRFKKINRCKKIQKYY